MKFRLLAALLISTSVWAQSGHTDASQDIVGRVFVGGHTMQYLQEVTDQFGGRLTGSPSYNGAAEWAAGQFRAMGIKSVHMEPFPIEHTWKRGLARGRILTPTEHVLHIQPLGWTPATPPDGIRGQIYVLDEVTADAIHQKAADIRGKIVLYDLRKVIAAGRTSYKAWIDLQNAAKLLQDAGAIGILGGSRLANQVLTTTSPAWDTSIAGLPGGFIGKEDAAYIMRMAGKQPVTVEFQYDVTIGGPAQVNNVIAEIRGSEKPDEWIILGAHLDSWDFATGAQDNGAGTSQVLEAARILSSLGKTPRRSIRFALWGGEEEGLLGSRSYVKQHMSEMKKCVAVLNTDNGAGTVKGWKVEGRDDLATALKPFSTDVLTAFDADDISDEITYDTDHGPFMVAGVPALDMEVDMEGYMQIHHTAGDTIDKVNVEDLNIGSAVLILTAYHIAQAEQRIAAHLDRDAVGKIIKEKDLDQFLKMIGDW